MDEATLTRTLQSLATEPVLHTSPSSDARARAHRLRRRRRIGAAAGVVSLVVVAGVGFTAQGHGRDNREPVAGPAWVRNLQDRTQPNHATTGFVTLPRKAGGQYAVYWQHDHLCLAFTTSSDSAAGGGSGCSSVTPVATQPMTQANVGGEDGVVVVSVSAQVAEVVVHRPDGTTSPIVPVTADGFPYRVVVATGRVTELRAYDQHEHSLGAAVAGPDAVQLRPVLAGVGCPLTGQGRFDVVLPSLDSKRCYGLAPTAMTLAPSSAEATYDPSQGWTVAVTLDAGDRTAFGALTGRLAAQPAPRNQLAVVVDGKVLEAPTIQEAIPGGSLVVSGGSTPFTQQEAEQLATMLAG